jgi:hypothetical protein
MEPDDFQAAAKLAEAAFPDGAWFMMSPALRAAAIYSELRKLDELRRAAAAQPTGWTHEEDPVAAGRVVPFRNRDP